MCTLNAEPLHDPMPKSKVKAGWMQAPSRWKTIYLRSCAWVNRVSSRPEVPALRPVPKRTATSLWIV